jgi:hypothetical protein
VLLVCTIYEYSVLHSERAVSRKPFGIGHMYIYTFCSELTFTPGTFCVYLQQVNNEDESLQINVD